MSELWQWLTLVGLGAYHGINPAMGWLFAVALGVHRESRRVVHLSLVPIAAGHAAAVALVLAAALAVGSVVNVTWLARVSGVVLLGWAAYHVRYGSRHRTRVGMRTGMGGLALWSFLMASAHGAGLMLLPVFIPLSHAATGHGPAYQWEQSAGIALAAVATHTAAMLVVTGIVAVIVYEWVGVAVLRRGWVNLDLIWTAALVVTGVILLLT